MGVVRCIVKLTRVESGGFLRRVLDHNKARQSLQQPQTLFLVKQNPSLGMSVLMADRGTRNRVKEFAPLRTEPIESSARTRARAFDADRGGVADEGMYPFLGHFPFHGRLFL